MRAPAKESSSPSCYCHCLASVGYTVSISAAVQFCLMNSFQTWAYCIAGTHFDSVTCKFDAAVEIKSVVFVDEG